jgi:tetratricopeptide (TPR) repeat protein
MRGIRACFACFFEQWDEALAMLEEFLAECEAGSPHYNEINVRRERGRLREARGDLAGALADYERALSLGRSANDPQGLLPTVGTAVRAFEERGQLEEARALARELVDLAAAHPHEAVTAFCLDFAYARLAAEFEPELRKAFEGAPEWPWKKLAFVCLDRDFARAAEMWADAGSPTWEARLRVRAAEELIETDRRPEGELELRKAMSFYRTVGATFFIQRGEYLLARSA